MPEAVDEPLVGKEIGGKYRVIRPLGSGGMGAVFEAENTWTGRHVAVKVLRREFASRADVVERFRREARVATQIAHPNIVDVLDMGLDERDDSLFIVQELLVGEDLRSRLLSSGTLRPQEALDALIPVMGALVAAHRDGIIHRDIKPENIFLVRSAKGEVPKLIDFGIAKIVGAGQAKGSTGDGNAIGTAEYMSPEQLRGAVDLDARTDVWAMGVVLFECIAGVGPFDAASSNEVIARVLTGPVPRLETFAPGVPSGLADVVARALERNREDRLASMRAMVHALLDVDAGDSVASAPMIERYKATLTSLDEETHVIRVPPGETAPNAAPRDTVGEQQTRVLIPARRRGVRATPPIMLVASAGLIVAGTWLAHATRPRGASASVRTDPRAVSIAPVTPEPPRVIAPSVPGPPAPIEAHPTGLLVPPSVRALGRPRRTPPDEHTVPLRHGPTIDPLIGLPILHPGNHGPSQ